MSDFTDNDGQPIFTDNFVHKEVPFENVMIDVIETNGNLWLSATDALSAMGFQPHHKGGFSRTLQRAEYPDLIKITDTAFRFTDGRRNRGSLISPRAVVQFADGKTQGRNPIMVNTFIVWMEEHLLIIGGDANTWSPARKTAVTLDPVFHSVITVFDKDQQGRELDPLRPKGLYRAADYKSPIGLDELEFCLCGSGWDGFEKCWCDGKGRLRRAIPEPIVPYDGNDVLDLEDNFVEPCWHQSTKHWASHNLLRSRPWTWEN